MYIWIRVIIVHSRVRNRPFVHVYSLYACKRANLDCKVIDYSVGTFEAGQPRILAFRIMYVRLFIISIELAYNHSRGCPCKDYV